MTRYTTGALRVALTLAVSGALLQACASAPAEASAYAMETTVAAAPSPAVAPADTPAGFSARRLSDHIRYLADDRLEGRFPGAVGEELTLDYLQAQYEALGLEPGGPNGQWRQAVDLVRLTPQREPKVTWTGPDGAPHALAADAGMSLRSDDSGSVRIQDAPVVFAGHGVVAPERGWDDYGGIDLTGKVVLILPGQPASFGVEPTFYGSGRHKEAEALKRGAVGVVTLTASAMRGYGSDRNPRMSLVGAVSPRFTGFMGQEVADGVFQASGPGRPALRDTARNGGAFRAVDLGVRINVDLAETTERIRSHNLLARIPGTTRPDEVVVYSAHWDHVGVAPQPDAAGDRIFNGAWDNASGTAGLIETARAFKAGPPPERTVVFLHVTAEEQGLLGSEWYGQHPVYPLETTAADINIDMLPFTPATWTVALFGVGKSSLEDDLARLAAPQGRTVVGEGEPEQGFYYRSDHFNFAIAGVPAIMPWTAVDFVEGGEAVGKPFYREQMRVYYHELADEWRPDYDFTAALQNLELFYRLGLGVANSREWPTWYPTAEFNTVRDASAAARR